MRHWSFWEWLAYACLLLGAMILAADTGLRLSPELAHSAPFLSSPYWGFAPLGLVMGATALLVAKEFGWLQALGLQHPLNLFLERDSSSNLLGIHTFSGVTYIQISVASSKRVTDCKAWYRESYFSPDGIQPFVVEHNEKHQLPWSKSGLVTEIGPHDPPVRVNVAVFTAQGLEFDPAVATPSNLAPKLQQPGIHRLKIIVVGRIDNREVSEARYLFVHWKAKGGTFVELKKC